VQGEDAHSLNHLMDDLMPLSVGDPAVTLTNSSKTENHPALMFPVHLKKEILPSF
jgi:hypothetical protein